MRTGFMLSVLLNLTLSVWVGWLLVAARTDVRTQSSREPVTLSAEDPNPSPSSRESFNPVNLSPPFRWSQLESADYPTYVANLRAIGCPEQTLRDIISADLHATFARRPAGAPPQSGSQEPGLSGISQVRSNVESQRLSLPQQEARLVDLLLGTGTSPREAGESERLPAQAARERLATNRAVVLPLVLQQVDLSALGLDENRLQVIRDLRQGFVDDIGGPNQDPADPAYRRRWLKAQAESDELLRGFIGWQAYQEYELQAATPVGNATN